MPTQKQTEDAARFNRRLSSLKISGAAVARLAGLSTNSVSRMRNAKQGVSPAVNSILDMLELLEPIGAFMRGVQQRPNPNKKKT